MKNVISRVTPAMAVAILAIVIALSSSATAALMITGANIKDKTITAKDLKKGAVRSREVKNRSLRGIDLKKRTITGKEIANNTITNSHLKEGTITQSDHSTTLVRTINSGAAGFQVVTAQSGPGVVLESRSVTASCPAGKVAISASTYADGVLDITGPEVRRTGPASFTAEDPLDLVSVVGVGVIQLQVTCVNAA